MNYPTIFAAFAFLAGAATHAHAASSDVPSMQLAPLGIAVGHWHYQGTSATVPGQKGGKWTWEEDCGWSANRAFLTCSFTMHWPDKVVKSQMVITYNSSDKSYWHYEMFDSDGSGADPFISRMTVTPNTWTNYGKTGKKTYRVIYHFASPTKVSVRIESSSDKVHWDTLAQGDGVKQF